MSATAMGNFGHATSTSNLSAIMGSLGSRDAMSDIDTEDGSFVSDTSLTADDVTISTRFDRQSSYKDDDGEEYDTDLEIEEEKSDYNLNGERLYSATCERLGVVAAAYVKRHLQDESLVMRHHGLGPLGARALAVPLVSNTSVLTLDLEDNWLEAEGAVQLAEMLKDNCYITNLTVSENRIGSKGAQAMCEMLLQNSNVTQLNLSGNGVQDKDAEAFSKAILENGYMRELNLSHNDIGVTAGALLGYAIGENETLEKLDLSWNHFRGKSALALIDGIKNNSRLKIVNLSWNGLGNEGAVAVGECLRNNHVLAELDITNTRITLDGAAYLARGLDVNETLNILKAGQNPIGAAGALLLLNAIHNERSVLHTLELTHVCVDKDFVKLLSDIRESRELVVRHGGVLSDYVIKCKPKSTGFEGEGSREERCAFSALERLVGMATARLVLAHVRANSVTLMDVLAEADKDKKWVISLGEFMQVLKCGGAGDESDMTAALQDFPADTVIDCSECDATAQD